MLLIQQDCIWPRRTSKRLLAKASDIRSVARTYYSYQLGGDAIGGGDGVAPVRRLGAAAEPVGDEPHADRLDREVPPGEGPHPGAPAGRLEGRSGLEGRGSGEVGVGLSATWLRPPPRLERSSAVA